MTQMLRRGLLAPLVLVVLAAAAVSGCGSSGSAGADPSALAPESSFVYVEATIDPSGSQESAMRSILADLPGSGPPEERLGSLIQQAAERDKSSEVDYKRDVEPLLGERIGLFVAGGAAALSSGNVPVAAVMPTDDPDAAKDLLEKDRDGETAHRRYRDVEYLVDYGDGDETAQAVVDGNVVLGNDAGVKAAIDVATDNAKPLDDADRFKAAMDEVSDERVGFMYADLGGLIQLASQQVGGFPAGALLGRLFAKPIVITARAEQQALVFEGNTPASPLGGSGGDPTPIMSKVPSGAWGTLALPGFGEGLKQGLGLLGGLGIESLLEQVKAESGLDIENDVLAWIGDVALFVDGDSEQTLGGGLLIQTTDPDASKRALAKLAGLIAKSDPSTKVVPADIPGAVGYLLQDPEAPRGVYLIQAEGGVVGLVYGEDEAKAFASGAPGLTDAPDFSRAAQALGGGYRPSFYLSFAPILQVAENFGAGEDPDYQAARPYLTILDYLIAGGSPESGGKVGSRLRLGFKPHE